MPAPRELKQVKDVGLSAAIEVERVTVVILECGTKAQQISGIDAAGSIQVESGIVYIGDTGGRRLFSWRMGRRFGLRQCG